MLIFGSNVLTLNMSLCQQEISNDTVITSLLPKVLLVVQKISIIHHSLHTSC